MKIINTATGEVISEIIGGANMTLDEAIKFVGEIDGAAEEENVIINGKAYYYEDLDLEA